MAEPLEKVKKRYRKKKTKLEEAFPSYLQVQPTFLSFKAVRLHAAQASKVHYIITYHHHRASRKGARIYRTEKRLLEPDPPLAFGKNKSCSSPYFEKLHAPAE